MEHMALGFLFGLGVLGVVAFVVVIKLRDSNSYMLKALLSVFAFLASVATIVGIFFQLRQSDEPASRTPEVTVAVMSVETATPAGAPLGPTPAPPPTVASPLLPDTFARLYYYSDLSTADSDPNWPAIKEEGGHTAYDDYGYILHSEESHGGWQIARDMDLYGDFALQIDVTPLTPAEATAYSIGFDWTSEKSGYYFLLTGDGHCALVLVTYGVPAVVKQNDECPTLSRDVLNRLLLIVEEQAFLAVMDNTVVLRTALGKRHGGPRVTLGIFSLENDEMAEARFNNLSIWRP